MTLRRFRTIRNIKSAHEGIRRDTLTSLIKRFEETGSVEDRPRSGRPSVEDDSIEMIKGIIEENPHASTRKVSESVGLSQSTVEKVLRHHLNMHPYRIHVVHALSDLDKQNRLEFCEEFLSKMEDDASFLSRILWTDEAHFHLNGAINSWNYRIWSQTNPHELQEQPLWSPKVTVCDFRVHLSFLPFSSRTLME